MFETKQQFDLQKSILDGSMLQNPLQAAPESKVLAETA